MKNNHIKKIYLVWLFFYFFLSLIYLLRFKISYFLNGGIYPELVEVRGLSNEEMKALDNAFVCRTIISDTFLIGSFVLLLLSML
jgi:hypothetical protein